MRRPTLALVFVGVLAVGGLAVAGGLKGTGKKAEADKQGPAGLKVGVDNSLPTISVGVSTGFNPTVQIDTGSGEAYRYLEPGWSYAGIKKDW